MARAIGVLGLGVLYEAAEHRGELVYGYAGGVGIRSGNPEDVGRLLRAGVYQQALADRKAGKAEGAAALWEFAAQRFPSDIGAQLGRAESLLIDRKDPSAALAALRAIAPPTDSDSVRIRHGLVTADALEAADSLTARSRPCNSSSRRCLTAGCSNAWTRSRQRRSADQLRCRPE